MSECLPEQKEDWRPVPDYPLYEVSSLGRVRGPKSTTFGTKTKRGYLNKSLINNLGAKMFKVHRIVMLAFVGPGVGYEVNHLNGNKGDNRLENLEYCTRRENLDHAISAKLFAHRKGEASPVAKLTEQQVMDILGLFKQGLSCREISNLYGITYWHSYSITRRRSWKHLNLEDS